MNLAVSNIAWPGTSGQDALGILARYGISGVEVAPTRFWPQWSGATPDQAKSAAAQYADRGFTIPALQAILFGKDFRLFGSDAERDSLADHLRLCADLAVSLGARSLVFGAPKNRQLNGLSKETASGVAKEFFSAIAGYYERQDLCLCLEANPPQYACEFMIDSTQAGELVRAVNSPAVRLHLDTACMYLAGEDLPNAIRRNFDVLRHFHVSEPFLGAFDNPTIDHLCVAAQLRTLGYAGWVSLEMREADNPLPNLERAVEFLARNYGGE